jgi:hypothetical protein
MKKSEWKWFGHPGHLCVAQWCRFHLATQVGDILVSTVGDYHRPIHGEQSEEKADTVGLNRLYETMSFKAGKPCRAKGCSCGLPEISGNEIYFEGYNTARDAIAGHMKACELAENNKIKES